MRARQIFERICHMFKVKNCKSVCLFCEYFEYCKIEYEAAKERKTNEHEICNEK